MIILQLLEYTLCERKYQWKTFSEIFLASQRNPIEMRLQQQRDCISTNICDKKFANPIHLDMMERHISEIAKEEREWDVTHM